MESAPKDKITKEEEKTNNTSKNSNYFSNKKFTDFDLSPSILETLTQLGYETATEVQAKSIPLLLNGEDIIGSAKTGSGKSLAFLIPAAEVLLKNLNSEGIQVLVLSPTRELAMQLFNVAKDLMRDNGTICSIVIGGGNRKKENEALKSGNVKLLVATPGRLLDHIENTKGFKYDSLKVLVIDEADKILNIGFEEELKAILRMIPKERQTMLFSATMNEKVEDLIKLSMKSYESVRIKSTEPTVSSLEQGYLVLDADKKFLFLFTFIKKNMKRKIIVFFSTCKEVEFFSSLLNYVDVPVLSITGDYKQQKRTTTFIEFCGMAK